MANNIPVPPPSPQSPPMNVASPKPPSMATITILCPTDNSQTVFDLVDQIKTLLVHLPGTMLDVRYRTTP